MTDRDKAIEWRKPTEKESEEATQKARADADRVFATVKTLMTVSLVLFGLVLLGIAYSIYARSFDDMAALVIFSVIGIIACLMIAQYIKTKARFKVRQCEEGKILVRDNIVIAKRKTEWQDRSGKTKHSYFASVRIVNSDEVGSEALREYRIGAVLFDEIRKGTTFVDVRYDPDLDGYPYFIIDQLWSTCK